MGVRVSHKNVSFTEKDEQKDPYHKGHNNVAKMGQSSAYERRLLPYLPTPPLGQDMTQGLF